MPRPGSRPYECVRRAWHSDRHQPIRGSLIQEIFRVVSEIHSSGTKRNKEWQEKLPIVVLKAEEIMYSKANSEAEYMDLATLWDRANDALNTIIRRDDSAETGDFLQPCIEAALHLGCIPRRASRSQQDNDPMCYLSSNLPEPMSSCQSNLKNSITSPHCMAVYSDIFNDAAPVSQLDVNSDNIPYKNFPLHFPTLYCSSMSLAPKACTDSVRGRSVYPLYYVGDDPQLSCSSLPGKKSITSDISSLTKPEDAIFSMLPQMPTPLSCDLSLRLGPSRGSEDTNKQSHHQEFQNTESEYSISKELHLFPKEVDAKYLHLDNRSQKGKALYHAHAHPSEEMICLLQPKLPYGRENPRIIHYPG